MFDTVPPIPPPFGANTRNPSSLNRAGNLTNIINNTTTTSVVQNVVDENHPQLLNSRGGSHVTNVLEFDKEDFSRPSETKDTKIAALRLKFNAFKALEGERVNGRSQAKDSDSDINEDQGSSNEFLADLNAEFHERSLLASQKRFYKRSRRVGSPKKPMDRPNETCFACGKLGHFQKIHNQSVNNNQKDYRVKYKGIKAEIAILTKKIDDMNKGKSEKGLVAESYDWDEESVSSDDERVTTFKALMAIADEELSVGRADARSGQWVEITMKKVQKLLSITNNDERRHVLDYTHVDLHYVEDQRKNLLSKFNSLKQEFTSCKSELTNLKNTKALNSYYQNEITKPSLKNESLNDEISDIKKVIKKWTSSRVTLDQFLTDQVPRNIVRVLVGKGMRKEKISSKEVVFTKSDVSTSETNPEIPSVSESEGNTQRPLPSIPKLMGAKPSGLKKQLQTHSDTSPPTSQSEISRKMENLNEVQVKELRNNNGTEFKNIKLEEFYDEKAKRRNKTLIEAARTMLNSDNLLKQFWGEAVNTACYTQNRSIIMKRHGKTAYDVFRGRSPDISYFHVTEGYAIHFNKNRSFLDDEFLDTRRKITQGSCNNKHPPYILAFDPFSSNNINIPKCPTLADSHCAQDSVSPDEQTELALTDDL
ncbi:retrovirus-related pol polyprotein from transposon TNT 1-94 [Tanacetum coccineum]